MFNLVPFAGARRKVTDGNRKTRFIRKLLRELCEFDNSNFQSRNREPLLPPPSAVMSNTRALEYKDLPSLRHHPRMEATAKAPVS